LLVNVHPGTRSGAAPRCESDSGRVPTGRTARINRAMQFRRFVPAIQGPSAATQRQSVR